MRLLIAGALACAAMAQTLPEGPGKAKFEDVCSRCHSPTFVIREHKTKDEWRSKVDQMLSDQNDVPAADADTIVEYLAKSFPPVKVSINKADAKQIESDLGFTYKDAGAIVKYRQDHGNFKTVDDLKKVPDIDAMQVDAAMGLMDFE